MDNAVNFNDIKIINTLGTGMYGTTYLAKYNNDNYALKIQHILPSDRNKSYKKGLWRELTKPEIDLLKSCKNIIGVGASAKGITILNFIKEDLIKNNIKIECILDENPFKINKIINSVNIEIFSMKDIYLIKANITFILFAWNFKDELIQKIKTLRSGNDKFINLFPLQIIN